MTPHCFPSTFVRVKDGAAAHLQAFRPSNRDHNPNRIQTRDHTYRRSTLENGLRVVTEAMPGVRSVALGVLVDAGPLDETPAQSGLAHLTEHLLFQGTSNRSARKIAEMMDLVGGQVGGFTARDYTCYFAHVLDEHCSYVLDLFGDLFLNSTTPPESVDREKDAILREIAAGGDTPSERVHDLLKRTAWANHPLGRPIAGRPETLQGLTREDVIYFFHKHYTPDRIILVGAGHVDHDDFVAQSRDAFWRLLGQRDTVALPPPVHRPGVVLEHVPLSQAYFSIAVPAPAYTHTDRYALHVLSNLMGGGTSSRLYRHLREERGLVYGVSSEYLAYRDAGMFVVEGSTLPEHLIQVLCITLMELWQLALDVNPVDEEEVWKARTQIRRQHLLAGEATSTRLSRLATQELYFGRHMPGEEVLEHIEAIDAETLRQLVANYLVPALRQATVAVVGPEAPADYGQGALEELLASFR